MWAAYGTNCIMSLLLKIQKNSEVLANGLTQWIDSDEILEFTAYELG
jgi:hypothetical protein